MAAARQHVQSERPLDLGQHERFIANEEPQSYKEQPPRLRQYTDRTVTAGPLFPHNEVARLASCSKIIINSTIGPAILDLCIRRPFVYFLVFAIYASGYDGKPGASDVPSALLQATFLVSVSIRSARYQSVTSLTILSNRMLDQASRTGIVIKVIIDK